MKLDTTKTTDMDDKTKKQMMDEEYGRDFAGCIWAVGFVLAIIVSAIVVAFAN